MYPGLLQDKVNALSVLQSRCVQLSQVKPQPVYRSNADAISMIQMYERDLNSCKQTLVNIVESVESCDGSQLDGLVSLSNDLEYAAHALSEIGHALCKARKRFGHARAEESLESIYHDLLQRLMNARSLLKAQHDHLSQAKTHKLALDESRQNLETLLEDAYYVSQNADDVSGVESMIAKVGSSVSQMSQCAKSGKDPEKYLAKRDDWLINDKAPSFVRCLRTKKC